MTKFTAEQLDSLLGIKCGETLAKELDPFYGLKLRLGGSVSDHALAKTFGFQYSIILSARQLADTMVSMEKAEIAFNFKLKLGKFGSGDFGEVSGYSDDQFASGWKVLWKLLAIELDDEAGVKNPFTEIRVGKRNLWELALLSFSKFLCQWIIKVIELSDKKTDSYYRREEAEAKKRVEAFKSGCFVAGYYLTASFRDRPITILVLSS